MCELAKVIPFPVRRNQQFNFNPMETEAFQKYLRAKKNLEERLGVPLSHYYGWEGDPEETYRTIERNMQKERLAILTRFMNDSDIDDLNV